MKKAVVAGILAVASVFALAGCGENSAATSSLAACQSAYSHEKEVADGLRSVVHDENDALSQYVGGTMTADDLATELNSLTTTMHSLSATEDAIDSNACS